MNFPQAVPEIPVTNVDEAVAYYVNRLGFILDWGDEAGGIAGISRGDCRLFLPTQGSGSNLEMRSMSSFGSISAARRKWTTFMRSGVPHKLFFWCPNQKTNRGSYASLRRQTWTAT